jgi:hypothetical protein
MGSWLYSAPSYWLLVISNRLPQWRNHDVLSYSMSCSIAIVCPFNNRHLFFTFFSFSFLLSFGFVFAPLMQPWPKPWSAATSWDTNVSNKETIFCSSSCLLFHLWSFWAYFFVCKIVWFDHFTHWFMLIGNMSLPAFSITRCVLLNQSFLLRERNLIKKMRECFPLEDLSNVNHPLPRRRRDLCMAPVSNQRWCIHFSWKRDDDEISLV